MTEPKPSFFSRIFLAFGVFFRTIFDADFAAGVLRLRQGGLPAAPGAPETPEARPAVAQLRETAPDAALQLLGLLQQEGRFVDFLEEPVDAFSDAEVGAAARVVHEGCRRAVHEHLRIESVRDEQEGTRVTLEEGFNASAVRLTGNVVGKPPFTGKLVHRGWRVTEVKLPKVAEGHDVTVLASAEVEL